MSPLQLETPGGPELLVVLVTGVILLIIAFALSYWVYTDAKQRANENASLWALVVGVFLYFTFIGGIVALGVYIWQREPKQRNQEKMVAD